jgi:hypothetical protein
VVGSVLQIGTTLPADKWQCAACLAVKPVAEFRPTKSCTSGYTSWCVECWPAYHYPRTSAGRKARAGLSAARHRRPAATRAAKPCVLCRVVLPLTEFPRDRASADRKSNWCKKCQCARAARARITRPRDLWSSKLKQSYGLTADAYDALLVTQNNQCALCLREASTLKRRLSVDHDHKTGKVRALLCSHCNLLLGHARDRADLLRKAASYLETHEGA